MAGHYLGHPPSLVIRKAVLPEQVGEVGLHVGTPRGDLLALIRDLCQRDLALTLAREVLARGHAEDARQAGRDASDKDREAIVCGAAHRAHHRERAHEAVLRPEDRLPDVTEEARPATLLVESHTE